MNNFGNIANAMASMQVNEDAGYAVPKDMVGKGSEYAQPVSDKPKKQLRKQREQQLALQKGQYIYEKEYASTSVLVSSIFQLLSIHRFTSDE